MAVNEAGANPGTGPAMPTGRHRRATCRPPATERCGVAPIVVPNTLWQAADPEAYDGGRTTDITHLREYEASGLGRRDDGRWGGALDVIPTKRTTCWT